MWKYLFAIVVSAAVITTSVYLYRHRDEMFRPDVRKLGGTRVVFAVEGGTPDDDYLSAMRRRFDPRGRLGVVVGKGDGEVEFLVPLGPTHDETVDRIERLAARPGKFAFVPIANISLDEGVSKYVRATYAGNKSNARRTPPSPPVNGLDGREFASSIIGSAPCRYRWVRLGESVLASYQLDPISLAKSNPAEKPAVARALRSGAVLHPNAQPEAMMLVARLPDEADPAFFLLLRDDSNGYAITANHVRSTEVVSEARGSNRITLRLDPEGVHRMNAIQQMHYSMPSASPRSTMTRSYDHSLALVIDDQVSWLPLIDTIRRTDALLNVGTSDEDAEDLVTLLRSTPQVIRLRAKPTRVEPLEPRR